jgi:hypothetical protein
MLLEEIGQHPRGARSFPPYGGQDDILYLRVFSVLSALSDSVVQMCVAPEFRFYLVNF